MTGIIIFQGILFLGRDITRFKEIERKYHRARNWLIPVFILFFLGVASIFFIPYFKKEYPAAEDRQKQELRNQLARDYLLLRSLLINQFEIRDSAATNKLIGEFFYIQEAGETPYEGLVLLDENLNVFDYYSPKAGAEDISKMIGSSYSGIEFRGSESSLHRVLTLYRADKDHPMGQKGIEVAFEMRKGDLFLGWLILQMDVEYIHSRYNINEKDLEEFKFKKNDSADLIKQEN